VPRLYDIVLVPPVPRGLRDDKGMPTENLRSKERGGCCTLRSNPRLSGQNIVAESQAV
jgi:hypothetical protein